VSACAYTEDWANSLLRWLGSACCEKISTEECASRECFLSDLKIRPPKRAAHLWGGRCEAVASRGLDGKRVCRGGRFAAGFPARVRDKSIAALPSRGGRAGGAGESNQPGTQRLESR